MPAFDTLLETLRAETAPDAKVDALISGLAARIKSTSNDQNVQKLARDLRAEADAFRQAFAVGTSA